MMIRADHGAQGWEGATFGFKVLPVNGLCSMSMGDPAGELPLLRRSSCGGRRTGGEAHSSSSSISWTDKSPNAALDSVSPDAPECLLPAPPLHSATDSTQSGPTALLCAPAIIPPPAPVPAPVSVAESGPVKAVSSSMCAGSLVRTMLS